MFGVLPLESQVRDSETGGAKKRAGALARGAEAHVLELLEKKPGARLKKQAISALGEIGGSAGAARAIFDAVRESSAPDMALEALAKMTIPKELAHLAGPECQKLRDEAAAGVRIWARCVLAKLHPHEEAGAVGDMAAALNDRELQHAAVRALGCLGQAGKQAEPALLRIALQDDKYYIRRAAARSLQKIGMDEVASMAAGLSASDTDERVHAAEALAELGPLAAPAVPPLLSALEDEDPELRASAARALGRIGLKAASALPALTKALADRSRSCRDEARKALQKIEPVADGKR
jgi:HEAT repeat protein